MIECLAVINDLISVEIEMGLRFFLINERMADWATS